MAKYEQISHKGIRVSGNVVGMAARPGAWLLANNACPAFNISIFPVYNLQYRFSKTRILESTVHLISSKFSPNHARQTAWLPYTIQDKGAFKYYKNMSGEMLIILIQLGCGGLGGKMCVHKRAFKYYVSMFS